MWRKWGSLLLPPTAGGEPPWGLRVSNQPARWLKRPQRSVLRSGSPERPASDNNDFHSAVACLHQFPQCWEVPLPVIPGSLRTQISGHRGHGNRCCPASRPCPLGAFQTELSPGFTWFPMFVVRVGPRGDEHPARMGRAGVRLERQLGSPPFIC